MKPSRPRPPLVLLALLIPLLVAAAPPPHGGDEDDEGARPDTPITVTARRLDVARESVEPSLGAATYTLTNEAVENRPGGETVNLGRVLVQMPGVAPDGSGRLIVRGAPGPLQYRINNVILPEGVADLGERLSARLADKVELIAGALPAQYGLQAGGVVNVTTKSGALAAGGQAELYGGSHGEIEPAFEYAGASGPTSLFVSASYLRSGLGLAAPDASARTRHDVTHQLEGFAYLDRILDADSRLSLMLGTSDERFQLPVLAGLDAATFAGPAAFRRPLAANGTSAFPSEALDGRRSERSRYAIASYLHSDGPATVQASLFARWSHQLYAPDRIGTLLFTGLAGRLSANAFAFGTQIEGAYRAGDDHTLRAGILASRNRLSEDLRSTVLPVDAGGRQVSDVPLAIAGRVASRRTQDSLFLQDEWRPGAGLTVNAGVRLDHVGGRGGGTALGPRASLVWAAPGGVRLHAGYARYFVPAPQQAGPAAMLAGTTGALPGTAGAPLKVETDDYWDVGAERSAGGLTIALDAWWRQARNLLDDAAEGPPVPRRSFNYARGRLRGVELSLTWSADEFSAWSSLAAGEARGKGIASQQFYFAPGEIARAAVGYVPTPSDQRVTASGGASYRLGKLRLSADALYGSGFPRTAGAGRLPAHVQLDMAAVYRLEGLRDRPLDLRVDLVNALDHAYPLRDGTPDLARLPEWAARRGIFVGFEQAF
ncbi:MAG: TonB-dependent receptor [Alphaproteobacteria bacterium]|nr:TonB-dependent receptor [Alphaproteobacteria bacterium]